MKNTVNPLTEDAVIKEARAHFDSAQAALRKGCEHALLTGIRLIWLHSNTAGDGHGGDRTSLSSVSRGHLKKGFDGALAEIGIPRPTAYRWMNAAGAACIRATLVFEGDDIAAELPEPGTPAWDRWDQQLKQIAQGMSLNRLLLGGWKESTEEHRYNELISADEEGRGRAADLLQGVSEGKYTLVQAVRALGSQEAYDRLRAEGGEKVRKDPVYLDFDMVNKRPIGLLPKAFSTLSNGFKGWEGYDSDAREMLKTEWIAVAKAIPGELLKLIKVGGEA